jgi:hypothetical protein
MSGDCERVHIHYQAAGTAMHLRFRFLAEKTVRIPPATQLDFETRATVVTTAISNGGRRGK